MADSGKAEGGAELPAGNQLLIAADSAGGRFDGRIEDPALLGPDGAAVASWDFSAGIGTDAVDGTHPGRLVNLPTRGVCGSRWTGAEMDWKHAPREYAAIHFHSDDLYDAGWQTDFAAVIPSGLKSGIYGVRAPSTCRTEVAMAYDESSVLVVTPKRRRR